jgi:hypothetical protein
VYDQPYGDRPAQPGHNYPPPPAPPSRKRNGWITAAIIAAVMVVTCAGGSIMMLGVASQNGSEISFTPDGTATPPDSTVVNIGSAARDGQFEFTVTAATCGKASYGPAKADGVYCEIRLTVANIGDSAQLFAESSQKAYDATGKQYNTDTEAAIYAANGNDTWFKDINPGNKTTGVLIFDMPTNVKIDRVELHDSPFSGGVVVKLRG